MRLRILFVFFFFAFTVQAQTTIRIVKAGKGSVGKTPSGEQFNRLIGNVVLEHEGALLSCDSAHLYLKKNSVTAFHRVTINQGDTIFLSGDFLEYDGKSKLAKIKGDVNFRDRKTNLTTPQLVFDRASNTAYYTQKADIQSGDTHLQSTIGTYFSGSKELRFKNNVIIQNPKYTIESDTVRYFSSSDRSYFYGFTKITNPNGQITCKHGFYDGLKQISYFTDSARVIKESQTILGDSIYYNQKVGFSEVYRHVVLRDTLEGFTVLGEFARYIEKNDFALITGKPIYSIAIENDSLHLFGDTIFTSKNSLDNKRELKVFHNVKIFKSDFQGACDSLHYTEIDSTFRLYRNPILWNGINQMTSDAMELQLKGGDMDSLFMTGNAFLISESDDSINFDQMRGRNMYGKFIDNHLDRIYVSGNGQTVYNVFDESGKFIGINRMDCSDILLKIRENRVSKVLFLVKPNGHLYPLDKIPMGERKLKGFRPRFKERPESKQDLR